MRLKAVLVSPILELHPPLTTPQRTSSYPISQHEGFYRCHHHCLPGWHRHGSFASPPPILQSAQWLPLSSTDRMFRPLPLTLVSSRRPRASPPTPWVSSDGKVPCMKAALTCTTRASIFRTSTARSRLTTPDCPCLTTPSTSRLAASPTTSSARRLSRSPLPRGPCRPVNRFVPRNLGERLAC